MISFSNERGFTLLEILVAMTLNTLVLSMVVFAAVGNRTHYLEDSVRTRVSGNLRGALDIVTTNVRQAGENLGTSFPAILLKDETSMNSDILKIRRSIISDNLFLCSPLSTSDMQIVVSVNSASTAECASSNVTTAFNLWSSYRNSEGGSIRIYVYNSISKTGEFLDYTDEGDALGEYYLSTSALQNSYPTAKTKIYIIEEFAFERDTIDNVFTLRISEGEPQTISFDISQFEIFLEMEDGSEIESLADGDALKWKDIKRIKINLSGEAKRAKRTFTFSETAHVFPRNIMSYKY